MCQASAADIGDAPDGAGEIVRHQHRAVRQEGDIHGPAPIFAGFGVEPSFREHFGAGSIAFRDGFAKAGQRVIIVAGVPLGTPGATNMVRIAYVGPNGDADI